MVRDVSEILKQCGWTDGFRIPVSNEENKKLENSVEDAFKKKAQLIADLEEAKERLTTIKKHLTCGEKQRRFSQDLLNETRKELDNAQRLDKVCRLERDSFQKGTKNLQKELQSLTEMCEKLQAEICKQNAEIENKRKMMECETEEFLAWMEKHKGNEDLQMIQTDLDEDEAVFKDLDVKREKLQMEVDQKRKKADSLTTEVNVLEEVLDRTAQLYRQMRDEKCELLKQWEASVRVLHRKDQEINNTFCEIDTLKAQGRLRLAELVEAKEMLENLQRNNSEAEVHIDEAQRVTSKIREQDFRLQKEINEMQDELVSIQKLLTGTNKRIKETREENKRLAEEKCQKEERILQTCQAITELSIRYEETCKGAMSAEQRASQMDELIKAEQHQSDLISTDIARLQGTLYRLQAEFAEVENQQRMNEIEIQVMKKSLIDMARSQTNQDELLFKAKEQLYNLDIEEQLLASRIRSLTGEGCKSIEQQSMQAKRVQVEETIKAKKKELNLLTNQVDRLELDGRRISNMIAATNVEVARVQDERTNLQLMVDSGKKTFKGARCALNDSRIELAVLKVKTRQVTNAERHEYGKVNSLKNQLIEWETAAKERLLELKAEKEQQNAERKVLMDNRSMLIAELNNLNAKLKQHASKYALISGAAAKDESGEFISATQLKLKMAQDRFMLVEEGDQIDAKIKMAEKEIEAMENTLKVVTVSNDNYRNRLAIIDPDGPEAEELKKAEQEYMETMLCFKKHREEETQAEHKIKELKSELHRLEKLTSEALEGQQARSKEADALSLDLQDQDVKLHRAESQLCRIVRDLRNRSNSTMFIMEEKDIMIRDLTCQNRSALEQLSVLANRFLDACPVIHQLLEERGICLPTPKTRSQSSGSRSTASSETSSVCSSIHSSESLCTSVARKLFKASKAGVYRGTMQTSSQLQFPMKKSVLCCAPHSPITLSSETLTIPSVSALPPDESETRLTSEMKSVSRIHPKCELLSGESLSAVQSSISAPLAFTPATRTSEIQSEVGSHLSRSGSRSSSFKSNSSSRSTKSKGGESLLGSLKVESLPLTGKPHVSKMSTLSVRSSKQRMDSSKSGEKMVTPAKSDGSAPREPVIGTTESGQVIEADITGEAAPGVEGSKGGLPPAVAEGSKGGLPAVVAEGSKGGLPAAVAEHSKGALPAAVSEGSKGGLPAAVAEGSKGVLPAAVQQGTPQTGISKEQVADVAEATDETKEE